MVIIGIHRSHVPSCASDEIVDAIQQVIHKGSREDAAMTMSSESSTHEIGLENFENLLDCAVSPSAKSPAIDPKKLEAIELEMEQSVRGQSKRTAIRQLLLLLACTTHVRDISNFSEMFIRNGGSAFLVAYISILVVIGAPMGVMEMTIGQYTSLPAFTLYGRIAPAFSGIGILLLLVRVMYSLFVALEPRFVVYLVKFAVMLLTDSSHWLSCQPYEKIAVCHEPQQGCEEGEASISGSCITQLNEQDYTMYTRNTLFHYFSHLGRDVSFTPAALYSMQLDHQGYSWLSVGSLAVLALAGIVAYKGTKFFTRLSMLLCLLPVTSMLILSAYGISLSGWSPLAIVMRADWSKLGTAECWTEATLAVTKTMALGDGTLLTLGSLGDFKNNIIRDVVLMAVTGVLIRVLATATTIPMMAFSHQTSDYNDTVITWQHQSLATLSFTALPSLDKDNDGHRVVAAIFYAAMVASMIGYQVITFEICMGAVYQIFPNLLYLPDRIVRYCLITTLVVMFTTVLGSSYMIDFNKIAGFIGDTMYMETFLTLITYQVIVIVFVYGGRRLLINLKTMCGNYFPRWYISFGTKITMFSWTIVLPCAILASLLRTGVSQKFRTMSYTSVAFTCIAMLPIYIAVGKVAKAVAYGRAAHFLFQPHRNWGPINVHNRRSGEFEERAARIIF